jgi:DNA-binding transcriptional LysR family regulator
MGLGYAWYPEESIREELESRRLVPLPLEEGRERFVTLYLIYADRDTAGPGVRQLAEIIQKQTAETRAAAERRIVSINSAGTTT